MLKNILLNDQEELQRSTMNSDVLVKMEIVHLIKFADKFAGIEVHLHVSGKNVKLNYSGRVPLCQSGHPQQKEPQWKLALSRGNFELAQPMSVRQRQELANVSFSSPKLEREV